MKKSYLVIIGTLAALLLIGVSFAGQGTEDGNKGHDRRWSQDRGPDIGRMMEHLELNEEQSLAVTNIMEAARPEFETLQRRTRENHIASRSLDVNDADFGEKLQNIAAENGGLATEMTLLQGRVRADVHSVLTPEQQQKLAETTLNRQKRLGERARQTGK